MAEGRKIAAVVNPRSAGGKTGKRWPAISRAVEQRLGPVTARFTERPGHAIELARELVRDGFDLVIAAGGDGTISEAANGFLDNDKPLRPAARLGILPCGLGGDFQRTLGISSRVEDAVDTLVRGAPLLIDVGKAVFAGEGGARITRYFVNVLSFGMGGDVASRAKNFLSPFSARAAFLSATVWTLVGYRGRQVRLTLDTAGAPCSFFVTNVAIGNGRYQGSGMLPCPTASPSDGIFEVTVIDDLGVIELVRDLRYLYSGDIYYHPKAHHLRAQKIVAEADEPTRLEVDGEALGTLPLEVTVLPSRLPVIVPPSSPWLRVQ